MKIFEINLFWITLAPTYYGLMYAVALLLWYFIFIKRWVFSKEKIEKLFFYMFAWIIFWWRIGYILFYNFSYYLENPIKILNVTEGWMSFHGWLLWVILAIFIFSKKEKESFLKLADELATVFPIWLFLWRIWNYLNKELLWFSNYNWPLAVKINWQSYFPSPLLEAFLEWIILFLIINFIYHKKYYKNWQLWALFLIFYWIFRFFVEIFFRTPDSQIWYIFWFLTMWSILSLPMVFIWIILFFYFWKNVKKTRF